MVERPIKKSDRQTVTEPNPESNDAVVEETLETEPSPIEGTEERPKKKLPPPTKDKTKGKGREQQKDEQSSRSPSNPALMRGPKPTKPKPPLIQKAQEAAEEEETPEVTESDSAS